jgi:hypothetical protein
VFRPKGFSDQELSKVSGFKKMKKDKEYFGVQEKNKKKE